MNTYLVTTVWKSGEVSSWTVEANNLDHAERAAHVSMAYAGYSTITVELA